MAGVFAPSDRGPIALRFIEASGSLFAQELALRDRVLREPLGLPPDSVRFPFEDRSLHLCAIERLANAERVVGCVLFHCESESEGRLFQMAVEPTLQGRGIGRRLVSMLETELCERGVLCVRLHARAVASAFYERLGYRVVGDPFLEVGIEHVEMKKALSQR